MFYWYKSYSPRIAEIKSPLFDSSYLVKRIYPHCCNFGDCTRSFVRYFSDHLNAERWWNSRDREWWMGMGAAWKIFKIAYVSTSLEADPFDRAELRLELLESESYLHGARGVFFWVWEAGS